MKVLIRVDSSAGMGTGHVMRCLTLARQLRGLASETVFACRNTEGNINPFIADSGFRLELIGGDSRTGGLGQGEGSRWLDVSQETDAQQCLALLKALQPDLTIVDHYGLDHRWHELAANYSEHLLVIDDLADRVHRCDVLLDQTFGRAPQDYAALVPEGAKLLVGSRYALLRPEFAQMRETSLSRRSTDPWRSILVSMGGTDSENFTGRIIDALVTVSRSRPLDVHVVMGSRSPALEAVRAQLAQAGDNFRLSVDLEDMAGAMSAADLAIGAAGSTAWERCCLGLPSLLFVLAPNQRIIALNLASAGAARIVGNIDELEAILLEPGQRGGLDLVAMSTAAARVTDGRGARCVVEEIAKL